jgi:hypothetical protein
MLFSVLSSMLFLRLPHFFSLVSAVLFNSSCMQSMIKYRGFDYVSINVLLEFFQPKFDGLSLRYSTNGIVKQKIARSKITAI